MYAKKCDACGKFFVKNECLPKYKIVTGSLTVQTLDICDECIRALCKTMRELCAKNPDCELTF